MLPETSDNLVLTVPASQPAAWRFETVAAGVLFSLAAVLLLARLGGYPLWDDEAITALNAQGVWEAGDTTAVHGQNVVAYACGWLLRDLHDRSTPPLPSYLAAPFVGLLGNSAWAARLPFAVMGLICVGLIIGWLWKDRAERLTWVLLGVGLVCNVSLWLYFRQCRYYAPAILASVALAYLYLHWRNTRRHVVLFAGVSLGLLASHYLVFAAVWVCLGVDYLLWGRRHIRPTVGQWLLLFVPQILLGGAVVWVWNTLGTGNGQSFYANTLADKVTLLGWICRDTQASEYGVGLLILAAPVFYLWDRDPWLVRAPLALLVFLLTMAALSPTIVRQREWADIRYLAPVIPLCVFVSVLVLRAIYRRCWWLAVLLTVVGFGTNLLHGGAFHSCRNIAGQLTWPSHVPPAGVRSTVWEFARELYSPPEDPYSAAIAWLDANVPAGKSVWVRPGYMAYPLIYHSPHVLYAWQLLPPAQGQFRDLPPIHFVGLAWPDYAMAFGPEVRQVMTILNCQQAKGVRYEPVAMLDTYWRDRYRPELFMRLFGPIDHFNRQLQAVYIFRRVSQ